MASNYGVMVAEGYGAYYVTIDRIQFGIEINSQSASARNRRTVYPNWWVESDFVVNVVMRDFNKFNAFGKWLAEYAQQIANGSAKPMRVVYPARNFDKIGVPQTVAFGDSAAKVLYPMSITFTTNSDLVTPQGTVDATKPSFNSAFSQAFGTTVDPEINLMLPFGYQLTAFDPGSYGVPAVPVVATPNFTG